jgi:predicted permease
MSWIRRFGNVFRQNRLNREIDEELAAHIEEAVEQGISAEQARQALGRPLRYREESRDIKLLPWLDSLASDVVFGWRRMKQRRTANAVGVLSLGLAIGATAAAFRLVDAVLLRKLPIAGPDRFYYAALTNFRDRDGLPDYNDDFDYPTFRRYRKAASQSADLLVVGMSYPQDATFGSDPEPIKLFQQYFSGNAFGAFGLRPAIGRLLTPADDVTPGAHPVAVISYDLWDRRFGRDPQVLGKRFRMRGVQFEVVGVAPKGFNGTEPGAATEVFLPAAMNVQAINSDGWEWFRLWVRPKPGIAPEQVRQILQAVVVRENEARLKDFPSNVPKEQIDAVMKQSLLLFPAGAGASNLRKEYRKPLLILSLLVGLVLLVACANVGNLLTAQVAGRAREMALRVSIGAGRTRLVQLVLVESALLAIAASILGALFAWWSAPLIASAIQSPDEPVRLILPVDWRAIGFGIAVAVVVTVFFGLPPALRASSVRPVSALKGGEDPHERPRLMKSLVAAQVAFCIVVQLIAGLFVTTFQRLWNRPLGFAPAHVLLLETEGGGSKQSLQTWLQAAQRLASIPGVLSATFAGWPLLTGNRWTGAVRVPGYEESRTSYFLEVAPRFFDTMRIAWIDGRDFRSGDLPPKTGEFDSATGNEFGGLVGRRQPGKAIVNEAFARAFFDGQNPVGKTVELTGGKGFSAPVEIVGYVRNAAYGSVREPFQPTAYFPVEARDGGALIVRTVPGAPALAPVLRREVAQAHAGLKVISIEPQSALAERQVIRERLLSSLSMFFAALALLLAGIGLYGVLNYSVTQQRKNIGIRMALGARSVQIVRGIALGMLGVVSLGAVVGLIGGLAIERFVQTLLFEVKATDVDMLAAPLLLLLSVAVFAALPSAIRATRIDPSETLRGE